MKTGDAVYVKSFLYEGNGMIMYISSNRQDYFPVQVEMDQPDTDGHRIARFGYDEITVL